MPPDVLPSIWGQDPEVPPTKLSKTTPLSLAKKHQNASKQVNKTTLALAQNLKYLLKEDLE